MMKARSVISLITIVVLMAELLYTPTYARAKEKVRIYEDAYSDLVAEVIDGSQEDVYFENIKEKNTKDVVSIMYINTEQTVTIRMKDGVSSSTDGIYVLAGSDAKTYRHIVLKDVHIDRSTLQNESTECKYAINFPGNTSDNMSFLRVTLQGDNTLYGGKAENDAGVWAVNLGIDGDGTLEAEGKDYGLYVKRDLCITNGHIIARGTQKDIVCKDSKICGGYFGEAGKGLVYGYPVFNGTINNGRYKLCELTTNEEKATKEKYPYLVRYTPEANEWLDSMIARKALYNLNRGHDLVAAYDMALTQLDAYESGNLVVLEYGMDYGFDMKQSMVIPEALQNDHPEYWWLWIEKTTAGSGSARITLKNSYSSLSVQKKTVLFEEKAGEVFKNAGLTKQMMRQQVIYALYHALAAHVSYNENYRDQSANSAFVEGQAVCDGYAKAFVYLLQKAGIPASYVKGYGSLRGTNGGMHGWVILNLEGNYYYCDPTWDDVGDKAADLYFLLNTEDISKQHTAYEDEMGYQLPVALQPSLGAPETIGNEDSNTNRKTETSIYLSRKEIEAHVNDKIVLSATLKDSKGETLERKSIRFTIVRKSESIENSGANVDRDIQVGELYAVTSVDGYAMVSWSNAKEGAYQVQISYAGEEAYEGTTEVVTILLWKEQEYTVGDFVLSTKGVGVLTEGIDYSYAREESGTGVLKVLSNRPMMISLAEGIAFTEDRISIATTDTHATARITLSNVKIDRSKANIKGTKTSDAGAMWYTSCISAETDNQKCEIMLIGDNEIKGVPKGAKAYYFSAIYKGNYTFLGEGSLRVTGGSEKNGAYCFGIHATSVSVISATLVIETIAGEKAEYSIGINADFEQKGGNVTIIVGDSYLDAGKTIYNYGIKANNFRMSSGSLDIETWKSMTCMEILKPYHCGIQMYSSEITGGSITIDADFYAINNPTSKVEVSNVTMKLTAAAPVAGELCASSGLFAAGNVGMQTIYGYPVKPGSKVSQEVKDRKAWYRVTDARGMMVSGGKEGIDYTYVDGVFYVLTATPLKFAMRADMQKTTDRIVTGKEALTYQIALENIIIDRSRISANEDNWFSTDTILLCENGNLDLNISGTNCFIGSSLRDYYQMEDETDFYSIDNTGIVVRTGTLTIDGNGELEIREPYTDEYSSGIEAGELVLNSSTVIVKAGSQNVGYHAVVTGKDGGSGNVTINGGTLQARLNGGKTSNPQQDCEGILLYGSLKMNGGTVLATAGNSGKESYGCVVSGDFEMNGGVFEARAEEADGCVGGLRCESDYVQRAGEVRVSGGVAGWNHASYGIVALGDFRICGGVLNAQAGTASGESGKSLGIYQPSISAHFDITGGRIGLRAAENSTMSPVVHLNGFVDITGGEFVAGNETENTVCGYAVADGYKVQKQDLDEEGKTALYPYTVVKEPRQEEDQEPRQEEEQEPVKDAEEAKAPVSTDMPKEEVPKEKEPKQEPRPAVNSRLKDIKSKAVYKVVAVKKNGDKNLL
ncbi:MAG: hypothetical protein K6G65_10780, partial [Lachnospiraceae bacterium]|nr:hypothetical protein [Lachnospiraceae bacterium]